MNAAPTTNGGCPRCGRRWLGFAMAHCAACHETFTTVGNFDRHNRDGCIHPSTVGLVEVEREGGLVWSMPAPDASKRGPKWAA